MTCSAKITELYAAYSAALGNMPMNVEEQTRGQKCRATRAYNKFADAVEAEGLNVGDVFRTLEDAHRNREPVLFAGWNSGTFEGPAIGQEGDKKNN